MPYTVKQLVEGMGSPIIAEANEPIEIALDRMLQHRFSQLPVTVEDKHYFITQESILSALHTFGRSLTKSGLKVRDALVKPKQAFFEEDPLFGLLDEMRDSNAAIVLDSDGKKIKYVVTTFNTTQFFRQWSEDMLHARDIELNLKRIITASFKTQTGEIDEYARSEAIAFVTPSNRTIRRKFDAALSKYVENCKDVDVVDIDAAEMAFNIFHVQNEQVKPFEKLTLDPYIQLFLSDYCWGRCYDAFGVDKEAVSNMLSGVRATRNKLAHFEEDEVTAREREQLKSCAEWFGDRAKGAIALLEATAIGDVRVEVPIERLDEAEESDLVVKIPS